MITKENKEKLTDIIKNIMIKVDIEQVDPKIRRKLVSMLNMLLRSGNLKDFQNVILAVKYNTENAANQITESFWASIFKDLQKLLKLLK
jgi:hypothetical protein